VHRKIYKTEKYSKRGCKKRGAYQGSTTSGQMLREDLGEKEKEKLLMKKRGRREETRVLRTPGGSRNFLLGKNRQFQGRGKLKGVRSPIGA